MNQSRTLITMPEAAERLALHEKTIRRYVANGQLTGYRIGPRILRVDLAEVDALAQPIPVEEASR